VVGTPVCLQKWLNRSSLVWKSRPMKPRIRWDIGVTSAPPGDYEWPTCMRRQIGNAALCCILLWPLAQYCNTVMFFFLFCAILHRNMNTGGKTAPIWKIFAMQARHSSPWQLGHVHVLSQPVRQLLITVMSPDELICRSSWLRAVSCVRRILQWRSTYGIVARVSIITRATLC